MLLESRVETSLSESSRDETETIREVLRSRATAFSRRPAVKSKTICKFSSPCKSTVHVVVERDDTYGFHSTAESG